MGEAFRSQPLVYVIVTVAIVIVGARYLRHESAPAQRGGGAPVPVRVSEGAEAGWAVVQVAGEVHRPGVYRLRAGERVNDAVRRAGGPTSQADLAGVNLAAKVEDGRQVIVPAREAPPGAGSAGASTGSGPGAAAGGAPLNLNTATVEQLDELDGVGPETARKIIAYREQHGGFRSVSELDEVPGIGPKRLAALKDSLRV